MKLFFVLVFAISVSAQDLSLNVGDWQVIGNGTAVKTSNDGDGNLLFQFPVQQPPRVQQPPVLSVCSGLLLPQPQPPPQPTINYLISPSSSGFTSKSISGSSTISMQIAIATTGTPVFNYVFESANVCVFPAHVRLLIWSKTGALQGYDRWWSLDPNSYELGDGSATVSSPITPDKWVSVFGERGDASPAAIAGFNAAIADVRYLGMTFGGGCFFGHGVDVSGGTATFTLSRYGVQ